MSDAPILLSAGDQLRTVNGRLVTFPRLTGPLTKRLKQLDAWLHAEATAEAVRLSESYATRDDGDFLQTILRGTNPARLSDGDRNMLNDVLFGDERGARACHLVGAA